MICAPRPEVSGDLMPELLFRADGASPELSFWCVFCIVLLLLRRRETNGMTGDVTPIFGELRVVYGVA